MRRLFYEECVCESVSVCEEKCMRVKYKLLESVHCSNRETCDIVRALYYVCVH